MACEITFTIQGAFAYAATQCVNSGIIAKGTPLSLVREPANPHDTNAVAVYSKTNTANKLGYVPRNLAGAVAAALNEGCQLSAIVKNVAWEAQKSKPYPKIEIVLIAEKSLLDSSQSHLVSDPVNSSDLEPLIKAEIPEGVQRAIKRTKGSSGVYAIRNSYNDKCYIGSSKNIGARLHWHFTKLVKGSHTNSRLQEDWDLYGSEVFSARVIKIMPESSTSDLEAAEAKHVRRLKSHLNGYNGTKDGSYKGGQATIDEIIRSSIHSSRARQYRAGTQSNNAGLILNPYQPFPTISTQAECNSTYTSKSATGIEPVESNKDGTAKPSTASSSPAAALTHQDSKSGCFMPVVIIGLFFAFAFSRPGCSNHRTTAQASFLNPSNNHLSQKPNKLPSSNQAFQDADQRPLINMRSWKTAAGWHFKAALVETRRIQGGKLEGYFIEDSGRSAWIRIETLTDSNIKDIEMRMNRF